MWLGNWTRLAKSLGLRSPHNPEAMSYTLIAREERKARTLHRCIWCGERIALGDSYVHERSIFEGDPQCHDWHLE
jgi:hypothetical protein